MRLFFSGVGIWCKFKLWSPPSQYVSIKKKQHSCPKTWNEILFHLNVTFSLSPTLTFLLYCVSFFYRYLNISLCRVSKIFRWTSNAATCIYKYLGLKFLQCLNFAHGNGMQCAPYDTVFVVELSTLRFLLEIIYNASNFLLIPANTHTHIQSYTGQHVVCKGFHTHSNLITHIGIMNTDWRLVFPRHFFFSLILLCRCYCPLVSFICNSSGKMCKTPILK